MIEKLTPWLGVLKAGAFITLLLAVFWYGHRTGAQGVQAKWDAEKLAQSQQVADANRENRAIESRHQTNVIEAQNAAQVRTKQLQVAADSARSESDSLRDELASLKNGMSSANADAVRQHADTLAAVLNDCQRDYQDMAATADSHASDVKLLVDAWPR